MTTEIRGEIAYKLHTQIANNEKMRRQLIGENAKLLSEILENNYYRDLLGDEEGEWAGYLGQLEIFYSRNKVNTLIDLHKKYTIELNIDPKVWSDIHPTRLMDMRTIVTVDNYIDWFAAAQSLTARDWNIELRTAKGLPHEEDDKHVHENNLYEICKWCGKRHKLTLAERHDTEAALKRDSK